MKQLLAGITEFDRATSLTPLPGRPGEFLVELDAGWSSLVGIHGGYMSAIAVRGAETIATDRPVRTISTSFLRSGKPGPAMLSVDEVRRGRSLSTVVAVLTQDDQVLISSRLTLLTERAGVEWNSAAPHDLPPVEGCPPFEGSGPVVHFGRVEMRLDPASLPGASGEQARARGYLRPREARPLDAAWLAMATDCFPPPAFVRLAPPTGGVSVDLTSHFHRPEALLGPDDWLTGTFQVVDSAGGLAVEHGRVALPDGTLVAESFQTRLMAQN